MINTQEEVAMCDECISHLMENVGPDHVIVKYREALIELDRLHKIAACIKWGDSDRLAWIIHNYPWTIGDEKTEMLRRLQEAAKLAEDSCK